MNVDFESQDIILELSPEGQDGKSVRPLGDWSATEEYHALDLVTYQGESFIALKDVPEGILPTDTEYWMVNASNKTVYWGTIEGTLAEQTDLATALADKADADDVYTKTETDSLLADKADADAVYTKAEADNLLNAKADSADVYTKTETDGLLNDKADADSVYTKTEADALLAEKADSDDVYTKTETDNLLSAKANTADLGNLAEKDTVDYQTEVTNKPTLGSLASLDSISYESNYLTDKPVLGTMSAEDDAPSDDAQYVRKNGAWEDLAPTLNDKADVIKSTASGSLVHLTDAAAMPVESLTVGIEPVQGGSGTPSPDNVRPISGHATATVTRTGANLYDSAEAENNTFLDNNSSSVTYGQTVPVSGYWTSGFISVKAGQTYYKSSVGSSRTFFYDKDKNPIAYVGNNGGAITAPSGAFYHRFCGETNTVTYNGQVMFNIGSSASTYEPYQGQTVTIDLDGTRYGGTVDALTGVMTVTHGLITKNTADMDNGEDYPGWRNSGVKALIGDNTSSYVVGSFSNISPKTLATVGQNYISANTQGSNDIIFLSKAAWNGWTQTVWISKAIEMQMVFPLATPFTVQLTPATLDLLYGTNNLWADSGDTTVGYRADTKLYIERLTQPTEDDMTANVNIASGKYFMINNSLFLSTASIASGETIVPGTNCTALSLADALNNLS